MMFDRHWLGDLALAVLLVLPLTGLCAVAAHHSPHWPSDRRHQRRGRHLAWRPNGANGLNRARTLYLPPPLNRSSQPAPSASEIESSTAVLWSRRIANARRIAQVASSWQSPQGA